MFIHICKHIRAVGVWVNRQLSVATPLTCCASSFSRPRLGTIWSDLPFANVSSAVTTYLSIASGESRQVSHTADARSATTPNASESLIATSMDGWSGCRRTATQLKCFHWNSRHTTQICTRLRQRAIVVVYYCFCEFFLVATTLKRLNAKQFISQNLYWTCLTNEITPSRYMGEGESLPKHTYLHRYEYEANKKGLWHIGRVAAATACAAHNRWYCGIPCKDTLMPWQTHCAGFCLICLSATLF